MAYIRPLANGNFRADVSMKGIVKNKTFPSKTRSILGGEELYTQLGIDLFTIRNQARLEVINALSKKELLQLSPQEIENMDGAELFLQAGKRISDAGFHCIQPSLRLLRMQIGNPILPICLTKTSGARRGITGENHLKQRNLDAEKWNRGFTTKAKKAPETIELPVSRHLSV